MKTNKNELIKKRPLLSVIIPVWNSSKYINRLLDSIVNQGWSKEDLEVIACDDQSTDNVVEIIHIYDDRLNIVYCSTSKDLTMHCPGNTRKEALSHVTGEWMTSIDNDDEFLPNAFDNVFKHIRSTNETMCVVSNILQVSEDGSQELKILSGERADTWTHAKYFNMDNLVKKYNVDYKENMASHEDLYFNSQVLCNLIGNGRDYNYLDIPTYKWYCRSDSLSHSYYFTENSKKYNYIEIYLKDFLFAGYKGNLDYANKYPEQKAFYFNQIMMSILHGYFYSQAAYYRLGSQWYLDEVMTDNRRFMRMMVDDICNGLKITRNDIINYIYNLPERYVNVKVQCYDGSNMFVELESFKDFIESL